MDFPGSPIFIQLPPDLDRQGRLLARAQARLRPGQRVPPQPGGHAARLLAGTVESGYSDTL